MSQEQSSSQYPGNPIGSADISTPEPAQKIVINLSPGMPEAASNPGNGCLFFIFAPFMWIINRRNNLSAPTEFEDSNSRYSK